MKLDPKAMRHLTKEDWRVLTAFEMGSKNHEVVPVSLATSIAGLRGGASSIQRSISSLAKTGLLARARGDGAPGYDGYRLTYGGYDYLALHTHRSRGDIYSVGSRIGVGKESDITIVADEKGAQKVLKIHRLGRISFRSVKTKRDYLRSRTAAGSWMYLSRLSAQREFTFMQELKAEGFPVPEPLAQSRHTVLMSLVDAFPLRQIASVPDPAGLYAELISLILRLAQHGLIHGDYNEFNILIREEEEEEEEEQPNPAAANVEPQDPDKTPQNPLEDRIKLVPIIIDFPQMVSMDHANAEEYFDRDISCIKRFFERRFHFVSTEQGPFFKDAKKLVGRNGARRLDAAAAASGFSKKALKDLEAAIRAQAAAWGQDGKGEGGSGTARGDSDVGSGDELEEGGGDDDEEVDEEGLEISYVPATAFKVAKVQVNEG